MAAWRQYFRAVALGGTLLLGTLGLQGCDENPSQAEEPLLHLYGWAGYMPDEILKKFTDETGIHVVFDVFESNEILEAKLLMGGRDYDVVFPSASPYLARQIGAGLYQKLDKSKLSHFDALDPRILKIVARIDPGNTYSVPYVWGTAGIGYNKKLVEQALGAPVPNSWALVFDPAYSQKLAKCGIALSDTPFDAIAPALTYLGHDANTTDEATLNEAFDTVKLVRKDIRTFLSNRGPEELLAGNLCVAQVWSGNFLIAQERGKELCWLQKGPHGDCAESSIGYIVPSEGAEMWSDCMAIPKNAPHPKNALLFINFILRPEIAAEITNSILFANANEKSKKYIKPSILKNAIIYPPKEILDRLYVENAIPESTERFRTRNWLRIKRKA